MTERANQHFVPQFYFKHFTNRNRRIHLLLKETDKIVLDASIKGQCARHKFYGPKEIEDIIGEVENSHVSAIRRIIADAWHPNMPAPTPQTIATLCEAVVFQRSRTALQLEKTQPALESMRLNIIKQIIQAKPNFKEKDRILQLIESGDIRMSVNPQITILNSLISALENASLIADLDVHILRNCTDYPFVFGDSPAVFYNGYYRNVTSRGVLGFQTPGLQIFMPLDSRTLLMLLDDSVYSGQFKKGSIVDVDSRYDVSQLNALQLHHSLNAIYFADDKKIDYMRDLWQVHKPTLAKPKKIFRVLPNAKIDDQESNDHIYHSFEPQLNFKLDLTFVKCVPIPESQYRFSYRTPNLVDEHRKRHPRQKESSRELIQLS